MNFIKCSNFLFNKRRKQTYDHCCKKSFHLLNCLYPLTWVIKRRNSMRKIHITRLITFLSYLDLLFRFPIFSDVIIYTFWVTFLVDVDIWNQEKIYIIVRSIYISRGKRFNIYFNWYNLNFLRPKIEQFDQQMSNDVYCHNLFLVSYLPFLTSNNSIIIFYTVFNWSRCDGSHRRNK